MWMPFLRAGWADGTSALYDRSVSTGIGRFFEESNNLIGVGLNWGRPSGGGFDSQFTSEIFYRIHAAKNFAITPSVQFIGDPALNPSEDFMTYFGVRARATF